MFKRKIEEKIVENLFNGKVIVIFGPRRSGKTTLSKKILATFNDDGYYLNCEDLLNRNYLKEGNPHDLKNFLGQKKIVILDEAQTVPFIGNFLKVFVDTYPEIQIIATGSSSFDLANKIGEPLVGRSYEFFLPPLSVTEINNSEIEAQKSLSELLIYGSFPQVVNAKGEDKRLNLAQLSQNYLYKDIFTFENLKKPKLIEDSLRLLAFQIGNQVSLNELATKLEVSRPTIERYLQLLEKAFVIKRIYSLERNRRDEVKNSFKVYFYDIGIRNYILDRLQDVNLRDDCGQIFENYIVMEFIKKFYAEKIYLPKLYFWRIYNKFEIDLIVEENGQMHAYECKWGNEEVVFTEFLKTYKNSEARVINKNNFWQILNK